jgi:hypothetical protein
MTEIEWKHNQRENKKSSQQSLARYVNENLEKTVQEKYWDGDIETWMV